MPGLGYSLSLRNRRGNLGFNPLSLSPALWLDASDASTLFQSNGGAAAAADGDPVGYWLDKSGNGKHLSQTDGTKKPLLKLNIQNGKPSIRFDGVNDVLEILSASGFYVAAASSMSAFIVIKASAYEQNYKKFYSYGANFNHGLGTYSTLKKMYCDAGAVAGTTALTNGTAAQATLVFSGSSVTIYKDGVSDGTGTRSANTDTTGNLYIGATTAGAIRDFYTGDVLELCLCIGSLTAGQRGQMQSYLNTKWGVY